METLPVREMILYRHGVGFFRREGDVNAEEVTLVFRHDEINDVLKSLAAFDSLGGHVLGIHYQTPLDKGARLADSSIRLSDSASLFDLLRDLRGREVTLLADSAEIRGRLIGTDVATGEEEGLADSLVSIASERDFVRVIRLRQIEGVRLHDERAGHDLHYFLDTSMSEELRRTVTVRLSAGSHHLVVYYVVPSPTWRVSYRLVADSEENGESGTALLQGWGLFDNRLDEDLEEVAVTLVAGQPISFIYDLYSSRIPERPTVEDQARVAPGPVEYRGAGMLKRIAAPAPAPQAMRQEAAMDYLVATAAGGPGEAAMPPMRAAVAETSFTDAVGHEAGEFFQYAVTTPVSVKRGDSALVPILNADLSYQKELLYNAAKLPDHPVAALRFENHTDLTLEHGPVTIIEDGSYKGEAILAFTKEGREVFLPYAVELGIRISEQTHRTQQMAGLNIQGAYLIVEEHRVLRVVYSIENHTGQDKTVTIEAPITPGHEIFDMREPDVATASERRWRVEAPAGSLAEFIRQERFLTSRREEVRNLDYRRLQQWLVDRWLDQAAFGKLSDVLTALDSVHSAHEEQAALAAEREVVYQRQGQLRENLGALQSGGEEGQLRKRMLDQLAASENRLEAIENRIAELEREVEETEARIEELLAALGD